MLADVPRLPSLIARHLRHDDGDARARTRGLVDRVCRHGLLVHVEALARAEQWPAGERAALAEARAHQARQALGLSATLADLHDACADRGVRLLALKGVALAVALHGNVAARQSQDLDLLVEPGRLGDMSLILRALQFEPAVWARHWSPAEFSRHARSFHEFGFHHADGRTVEVHTRLLPAFIPHVPTFAELWADRQTAAIAGRTVALPGWADAAVHLAIHGYRHAWARLGWLCDVAHLMARDDVPWEDAMRRAPRWRARVAVAGAVVLAHEVLGAPLPVGLDIPPRARRAAQVVADRVHAGQLGATGRTMLGDQWRSRDSVRDALLSLLLVGTTMTPADGRPGEPWPPSVVTRLIRRPLRLVRRYLPRPRPAVAP